MNKRKKPSSFNMEQRWTSIKSKSKVAALQEQKKALEKKVQEEERKQKKRAEIVYEAFPHPDAPLFQDVVPWARQGAYFVLLGDTRGKTKYCMHRECPGINSSALKAHMHQFAERHPVIVMDLADCPVLLREQEWPFVITQQDASYKLCTCSFSVYVMDDDEIEPEYYRLQTPYFYLCNLNLPGDQGFYQAALPHEQLARDTRRVVQ